MLSDQEKHEMRDLAHSEALREEFRMLRSSSRIPQAMAPDFDTTLQFLTAMSRFMPPIKRAYVAYTRVLL